MRKRILVTGASGFIGANLVRRLSRDGHEVHVLLRPVYQSWRLKDIEGELVCHSVDVTDKANVMRVVQKVRPQWIFHLAAYGAYPHQQEEEPMLQTNIHGIHHLMSAVLQNPFEVFINVGSSSEYGFKDHAPDEKELLEPNSLYALSKAYASMFCQYVAQSAQKNIITLRPYSVFGPFEAPTRFLPTLIVHGLEGQWPPLASPGTARDFIYVDDFVDACVVCAQKHPPALGQVFNIGTGIQTTLEEVVATAKDMFSVGRDPVWGSMPSRRWDTQTWFSNPRAVHDVYGWKAKNSFRKGFEKMIGWFRDHPRLLDYYKQAIFNKRGT